MHLLRISKPKHPIKPVRAVQSINRSIKFIHNIYRYNFIFTYKVALLNIVYVAGCCLDNDADRLPATPYNT